MKTRALNLNLKSLYLLFILVCLCFNYQALGAISVTTTTGNGADTYIHEGNRNTNYGLEEVLKTKTNYSYANPAWHRLVYLRFDISSISLPIDNAVLNLSYAGNGGATSVPSNYSVYGLLDRHPSESWDELTTTWNTAPGHYISSSGIIPSETTLLGTFSLDVTTTIPGDTIGFSSTELTTFLQNDTDGLATLIIRRQQQNFAIEMFASKEHTLYDSPRLVFDLNQTTIPVPGAFLLAGLGSGLVAYMRRGRN